MAKPWVFLGWTGYGGTGRPRVSSKEKSSSEPSVAHVRDWAGEEQPAEEAERQLAERWQESQGENVLEAKGGGRS